MCNAHNVQNQKAVATLSKLFYIDSIHAFIVFLGSPCMQSLSVLTNWHQNTFTYACVSPEAIRHSPGNKYLSSKPPITGKSTYQDGWNGSWMPFVLTVYADSRTRLFRSSRPITESMVKTYSLHQHRLA